MGINKVQYGNTTLIDLTSDTVTADKLLQGYTAHDRSGVQITGTATQGGSVTQDQDGFIVLPPDGSGGGGGQYAWLGEDAEKVGTVFSKTINLKDDTDYDSWTASTTEATILQASTDSDYTLTADLINYDYFFITKGYVEPVYLSGTPMTYTTKRVCQYSVRYVYGYPNANNYSNVSTGIPNTQTSVSNATEAHTQLYYNNAGNITSRSASQCGPIYMKANPTVQMGSWSNNTVPITYKLPAFYAKCDTSRFTTERKTQVDSANTNYYVTLELYRVPRGKGWISHLLMEMCADLNAE